MTEINKYNTAMIYSIRSNATDKYYIGSTTQILCKRFGDHKKKYKLYLDEKHHFVTSFKILELGDAYIELLEEINCENKNQLERREGELIREHKNNCVNRCIAGRTKKEYAIDNNDKIKKQKKQNYIDNKESISKKHKQYQIDNKELISKRSKQYYNDNKDKILEKVKQYNNDNKEHKKEYDKQRRIDNKDKIKQYNNDNKDKIKQQSKQYRIDNKELISDKKQQYYIDNIESTKAQKTQPYNCLCGSTIQLNEKARHNKTAKHLKALEQEIKIV